MTQHNAPCARCHWCDMLGSHDCIAVWNISSPSYIRVFSWSTIGRCPILSGGGGEGGDSILRSCIQVTVGVSLSEPHTSKSLTATVHACVHVLVCLLVWLATYWKLSLDRVLNAEHCMKSWELKLSKQTKLSEARLATWADTMTVSQPVWCLLHTWCLHRFGILYYRFLDCLARLFVLSSLLASHTHSLCCFPRLCLMLRCCKHDTVSEA